MKRFLGSINKTTAVFTALLSAPTVFGGGDNGVSIRLFEDKAVDGVYQATDPGIAGATIRAYGAAGLVATATDNGGGNYTINLSPFSEGRYRIEVDPSTLPPGLQASTVKGTSATFTEVVNVATTGASLDIPVSAPKSACLTGNDLDLIVNTYVGGSHTDPNTYGVFLGNNGSGTTPIAAAPALITFPVSVMGSAPLIQNRILATFGEIGATGGLAVQQTRNRAYAAALARRHVDWGPGGSGAIYVVDTTGAGVLTTITIPNTGNTQRAVDSTNAANNGTLVEGWLRDSLMFDRVGKEGLGDVEIDATETTLWTVNLNDRHLYKVNVDVSSPGYGAVTDLGEITASVQGGADDFRPFALKFQNGSLFVGAVSSGQTANNIDDVSAHVYRFTDPYTGTSMTEVFSTRVSSTDGGLEYNRGDNRINWKPWITNWNTSTFFNGSRWGGFALVYPQPVLTDIEFDSNNNLILGFRDRFGDQMGVKTKTVGSGGAGDPSNDNALYETVSMGEILHSCWAPTAGAANPSQAVLGDWSLEGTNGCGELENDANDGVNVTEHYHVTSFTGVHPETAQGGLATHPLIPNTVFSTSQDPFALRSGGIHRYHTVDNGANDAGSSPYQNNTAAGGYQVFDGQPQNGAIGMPGKSNGLGDVEVLCAVSPMQIGDVVWYDEDEDGIRDPREVVIPGVAVTLWSNTDADPDLEVVDTTTTDANGRYRFVVEPSTEYCITFDLTSTPDFNNSLAVLVDAQQLGATLANVSSGGGNELNDSDLNDRLSGVPCIRVTTSAERASNHALDAGLVVVEYDLGDAPATYGTLLADNGARHIITPGVFLGTALDSELNGLPNSTATGDDAAGVPDDEDGVTLANGEAFCLGRTTTVNITASANGFVNAWCDFDGNGVFDAGELVLNNQIVVTGANQVTITTPTTATATDLYCRFRFTTASVTSPSPIGELPDGEVEDYVSPLCRYDFGDLPAGYPTLIGDNGARHRIDGTFCLGVTVDDETTGAPSTGADGDDLAGKPDDEDGLDGFDLISGAAGGLNVTVCEDGVVNVFIDWNNNGNFNDPGEHPVSEFPVNPGGNFLEFDVPADVCNAQVYMRIRVTEATGQGNTPSGEAPNGEVEDYRVTVGCADLGDLPACYNVTTYADTGASHILDGVTFLGAGVDHDNDGVPSANASGDDSEQSPDDEDGVTFGALVPGTTSSISVTASVAGKLYVWADWNGDCTFDNAERIFANEDLVAGANTLSVSVPAVVADTVFFRFRFGVGAEIGQDQPTGQAANGEVEDYGVSVSREDFGDLPDCYGTLLTSNGARHTNIGPTLGASVDTEGTGAPSALADGDGTDEDGVSFSSVLVPGQSAGITFVTSASGFLSGWIDWNQDCDFADPGEAVVLNTAVPGGLAVLPITVPSDAATGGNTYARFRLTGESATSPSPVGALPSGEVEDYAITVVRADYGDAPTAAQSGRPGSYPVTIADNGACHTDDGDFLSLGQLFDTESNGQPSSDALADDNNGKGDDEDGVFGLDNWVVGTTMPVTVDATDDGFVTLWIDFNCDGDWSDNGEQVGPTAVVGGSNIINVSVPANACTGTTFLRARLATTAVNAPTGCVVGGEVEDHAVTILPVASLGNRVWFDVNNDGELNPGESGIPNVGLTVWEANSIGTRLAAKQTVTTDSTGHYLFTGLTNGFYVVCVNATNFNANAPLNGYLSSTPDESNPDAMGALDSNDNGVVDANSSLFGICAGVVSITVDGERTDEADLGSAGNGGVGAEDSELTVDFGFYRPVSLGNLVWHDRNNDGVVNGGEPGLDGVLVQLFLEGDDPLTDAPVATDTTAGGGVYEFTDLLPGRYFVCIPTVPAGLPVSSTVTVSTDSGAANVNNDDNGIQAASGDPVKSPVIELASASEPTGDGNGNDADYSVDFGFFARLDLGNLVWNDLNNNGQVDSGEPGIDGVTVDLYFAGQVPGVDAPLATDVTSAGGIYGFTALNPGSYFVYITTPPASAPRSSEVSDLNDNGQDGDDNGDQPFGTGTRVSSGIIVLTSNGEPDSAVDGDGFNGEQTVDFGFYEPLSLGNVVWFDVNNSGHIDGAEAGIANVTVNLWSAQANGTPVAQLATDTTDGNGYYLFDNLTNGTYVVQIPAAAFTGVLNGYVSSTGPNEEALPNSDGDRNDNGLPFVNGVGVLSGPVTLLANNEPAGETDLGPDLNGNADANSSNLTVDFGFYRPVSLGNLVWHDRNNDGLANNGEPGVDGVFVQLFREGDDPLTAAPVATDTTAGGGLYDFTGLVPGRYFVCLPGTPAGLDASSSVTVNADAGAANVDNDDNGAQTVLGGAVKSPVVALISAAETTGDGNGPDADYTVDFGFYAPLDLGNLVWCDLNNNGAFDPGTESGVDGVAVQLFRSTQTPGVDAPVASTTTAGGGLYRFDNLSPGQYVVYIPNPPANCQRSSDVTDTQDNAEDNDDNGSQPGGTNTPVSSPVITLLSQGETDAEDKDIDTDLTVDFGFYQPVNVGSLVWNDANNNGVRDNGEAGIDGVIVELYRASQTPGSVAPVTTTTTSGGGAFSFTDLPPGDYILSIPTPPATAPRSSDVTDSADNADDNDDNGIQTGGTGARVNSPAITLLQDTESTADGDGNDGNLTVDFGFYQPVNIGNLVWHDANNNGARDNGEIGLNGVTVQLFRSNQNPAIDIPVASTTTAGGGNYAFGDLPPGDYVVCLPSTPSGYPRSSTVSVTSDAGAANVNDRDFGAQTADGGPTKSPVIALLAGTESTADTDGANGDLNIDFGFFAPLTLGNRVWHDQDNNGLDDKEPGINGVTVELYRSTQIPGTDAPVASTVTAGDGHYTLTGINPGDYVVYIPVAPAGQPKSSDPTDTGDNAQDYDDNGIQGGRGQPVSSPVINLVSRGETGVEDEDTRTDLTVDFGFYLPVVIGDLVFEDVNGNGLKDATEPGVTNVTVNVRNNVGNAVVGTTTTGSDGAYRFTELPPGDYYVEYIIPTNMAFTVVDQTSTNAVPDAVDSDANRVTGLTPPTGFLQSGSTNLNIDAGAYVPAKLGDAVWIDVDRDGVPDENLGVLGWSNVVVSLYWLDGTNRTLVATNRTVLSTNNNSRGFYQFTGLRPGTYLVEVDPTGLPPDFRIPTTALSYTTTLLSGQVSTREDFGFISAPTAVDLVSFSAAGGAGGAVVSWTTGSETDNLGFNVYRSTRLNGARVQVNGALVEGQGSGSGADYQVVDTSAPAGKVYYWLEDIEFSGKRTQHGPAVATVTAAAAEAGGAGLAVVEALPVLGLATQVVVADENGQASFTAEGGNVLVTGVAAGAKAVDVSATPAVERRGEAVESATGNALYFSAPKGARIEVR